jgi:hypothetical protein
MRKFEEDIVRQMLGKEDCPFATAGWLVTRFARCSPMHPGTQVKALAREWPEIVMSALGVGTRNTRDALEIVATGAKPFPDLLDTFKAIPAVGGGVLLIVLGAEVAEVATEIAVLT